MPRSLISRLGFLSSRDCNSSWGQRFALCAPLEIPLNQLYGAKVIPRTVSLRSKTAANSNVISGQPKSSFPRLSVGCFRLTITPTAAAIQNNDSPIRAKAKAEGIGRKIRSVIAVPRIAGSAIIPIMAFVALTPTGVQVRNLSQ